MLEPDESFSDELGASIPTIKVEKGTNLPIFNKPKIYYDLFPEGMKPRRIKLWDDNYESLQLSILGYCIATRNIPKIQRWLPSVLTQVAIFRDGEIPKGWKKIDRIPPYHKLRIDLNNLEIQLVGPAVNLRHFSDWYQIIILEKYKELWDNWWELEAGREKQQHG